MSRAFDAVGLGRGDPDAHGLDAAVLEDHRSRIHMHAKKGAHPGMAECVLVDGKVVYNDCCGWADKEHKIPMTERTLFRGYSMMKPITASAFMTLVEEGLVGVDDAVSDYLPGFAKVKVRSKSGKGLEPLRKKMTLRHLMMHTSGIGYGPGVVDDGIRLVARTATEKALKGICIRQDEGEIDTLEKLCDALLETPLSFQPGAGYEYGLGVDVLGRVMELVTGQPLKQIIQERILTPVGMKDTVWDVPRSAAKQICGYYRIMKTTGVQGRWLERLDGTHPEDSAYVRGSESNYSARNGVPAGGGFWGTFRTGLLFSMRDVALFCQMLLQDGLSVSGNRVLKPSTIRSLRRNWFELKTASDKKMPPGWTSDSVGWSPIGHVQLDGPHTGAMFMGGMSYWWVDFRRKIVSAIMTETYWQCKPIGWKDPRDTMDQVLARAVEAAASTKKRKRAFDDSDGTQKAKKARKAGA